MTRRLLAREHPGPPGGSGAAGERPAPRAEGPCRRPDLGRPDLRSLLCSTARPIFEDRVDFFRDRMGSSVASWPISMLARVAVLQQRVALILWPQDRRTFWLNLTPWMPSNISFTV